MKPKFKFPDLTPAILFIGMWLYFLLIMISVSAFWIGFHSIDTAHNMHIIENAFDSKILDRTSTGLILDSFEVYKLGLIQMFSGFGFAMFGMFGFCYLSNYMFFNQRK